MVSDSTRKLLFAFLGLSFGLTARERLPLGLAGMGHCTTAGVRHLTVESGLGVTSPRLLVSTLVLTVLRQGGVMSADRPAPQDTPHNNSAELALLHPLTDKKMGLREATLMLLWQWELHVTAVLTTMVSSFLMREVTFRKLGFVRISGITSEQERAWGPQILGTTISRTRSPKWATLERLQ